MIFSKTLAPSHSVLLVMDRLSGEVPHTMNGKAIASTASCVAVGTYVDVDGETSVVFTDETPSGAATRGLQKVFSGVISTPSRAVHLCTVSLEPLAEAPVASMQAKIEVWTNEASAPDRVLISIDGLGIGAA